MTKDRDRILDAAIKLVEANGQPTMIRGTSVFMAVVDAVLEARQGRIVTPPSPNPNGRKR